MPIKSVRIWRNPTKTETRIYVEADDGRQGCLYRTTTKWHKSGDTDGKLTNAEWKEARRVAVWDGLWHNVSEDQINSQPVITEPKPAPVVTKPVEPRAVRPGWSIAGSDERFDHMRHRGAWFAGDDSMWIVVSSEQGTLMTEDGPDPGWFHTIRPAIAEEIAEYRQREAEWNAKSSEERVSEMLSMFPEN